MVAHVDVDIAQVWRDYKEAPSIELRNQLVEKFLPLVKYNAERIWQRLPDGVDLDDLISAGIFGLMDAIEAFDLERQVKFETYCVPRIRGAMLDELRTMDWVPRLVRSKASKMEEARKTLEAALGRPPSAEELASRLQVPLEEFHNIVNVLRVDRGLGDRPGPIEPQVHELQLLRRDPARQGRRPRLRLPDQPLDL